MLFVLLLVADIFLGSAPSDGSSPGKLVSFYVKHDTTVLAATYLQIVIAIVFVAFLVGLYSLLRRAEGAPAMLSTAALGLGLVTICFVLINQAFEVALAGQVARRVDPVVLWSLFRVGGAIDILSDLWHGLFLAAASLALIRTQVLPRWIGWTGLAGALGFILGTFSVGNPGTPIEAFLLPGFVCFLVWTLATSIFMVRGRAALSQRQQASTSREVAVG
jgi:membrane-bound ClpP family serine protease